MTTWIACLVAGVCAAGFVAIWFTTAYKELWEKRCSMEWLYDQLALHERLYAAARDGPDEKISESMLNTSRMLCSEGAKGYNRLIQKPMNRLPAWVLGFRPMREEFEE